MLEVRILGMQKEPTGLMKGHEIHDFQYRTRDADNWDKIFKQGKDEKNKTKTNHSK